MNQPLHEEAAAPSQEFAPLLLTYEQAGYHLGVSEREIRRMVAADRLPMVALGRLKRIAYDDLRAWIKRQRKFHSYYLTPETYRLQKKQKDNQRLDEEFRWE